MISSFPFGTTGIPYTHLFSVIGAAVTEPNAGRFSGPYGVDRGKKVKRTDIPVHFTISDLFMQSFPAESADFSNTLYSSGQKAAFFSELYALHKSIIDDTNRFFHVGIGGFSRFA